MMKYERTGETKAIKISKLEPLDPRFHPSPGMKVTFSDGKVLYMNRTERRRNHLYGDRLKRQGRE